MGFNKIDCKKEVEETLEKEPELKAVADNFDEEYEKAKESNSIKIESQCATIQVTLLKKIGEIRAIINKFNLHDKVPHDFKLIKEYVIENQLMLKIGTTQEELDVMILNIAKCDKIKSDLLCNECFESMLMEMAVGGTDNSITSIKEWLNLLIDSELVHTLLLLELVHKILPTK